MMFPSLPAVHGSSYLRSQIPALCPVRRRIHHDFSSVTSFPRRTPPLRLQLCSPASTVLRSHLTSHQRSCQHYHQGCLLTVPVCFADGKPRGSPGSRVWSFQTCAGSSTPPRRFQTRQYRPVACCLPAAITGSARETKISELNSWPVCTSYQCYTQDVTVLGVWFEAGVTG